MDEMTVIYKRYRNFFIHSPGWQRKNVNGIHLSPNVLFHALILVFLASGIVSSKYMLIIRYKLPSLLYFVRAL